MKFAPSVCVPGSAREQEARSNLAAVRGQPENVDPRYLVGQRMPRPGKLT